MRFVLIKNDDPKNGVSTKDLVMIQKHLLGIELLVDPHDFIAADINNDGKISARDLLELRKLILGSNQNSPTTRVGDLWTRVMCLRPDKILWVLNSLK